MKTKRWMILLGMLMSVVLGLAGCNATNSALEQQALSQTETPATVVTSTTQIETPTATVSATATTQWLTPTETVSETATTMPEPMSTLTGTTRASEGKQLPDCNFQASVVHPTLADDGVSSIGEPTIIFTVPHYIEIYDSYPNEQKLLVGIRDGEGGTRSIGLFDLVEKKLLNSYPTGGWPSVVNWVKEEGAIIYTSGDAGIKFDHPLNRIDMGLRSISQPVSEFLTTVAFAKDPLTGDIWTETTVSSIKALPTSAGKRVAPLTLDGLATLPSDDYIRNVAWSFDGQWLAMYSHQGIFYLLDRQNQNSCRFDIKGLIVPLMRRDYEIGNMLWNPVKQQLVLTALDYAENGIAYSSFPLFLDVMEKKVELIQSELTEWQTYIADRSWSPDGKFIAFRTTYGENNSQQKIHIYNVDEQTVIASSSSLPPASLAFTMISWIASERLVTVCGVNETPGLCNLQITLP